MSFDDDPGMVRLADDATPFTRSGMPRVRVTIAIVTYYSKPELSDCLDSILASDIPAKVVAIDNGSSDGTLELANEYARQHSNIVAVASGGNIGLADSAQAAVTRTEDCVLH